MSDKPKRAKKPKIEKPLDLEVEIIYDAPRTAAYDAMWREIIDAALERLDAKAAQKSGEHERSDTSTQAEETSPHEEGR